MYALASDPLLPITQLLQALPPLPSFPPPPPIPAPPVTPPPVVPKPMPHASVQVQEDAATAAPNVLLAGLAVVLLVVLVKR